MTPALDRHDIYVAASRARRETCLVVDRRRVEQEMRDRSEPPSLIDAAERRHWLAKRLSVAHVKETTLDVAGSGAAIADRVQARDAYSKGETAPGRRTPSRQFASRQSAREAGHEL